MNPTSAKEESVASSDTIPEYSGGWSVALIGAVCGASLGVVLAALLDMSAPLVLDAGVGASWIGRGWVIGALAGAASGYVIGALVAWELSDDPPVNKPSTDDGDRDSELPVVLESLEQQDCSNSRGESNFH